MEDTNSPERCAHRTMLGLRLSQAMARRSMSTHELASATGTCYSTVSRVVKGRRGMQTWTLCKCARVLDCSTDFLLGLSESMKRNTEPAERMPLDERPARDGWLP